MGAFAFVHEAAQLCKKPQGVACLTLPDDDGAPTSSPKRTECSPIALHICSALHPPECPPLGWFALAASAAVQVPRTPVDEECRAMPGQHLVRASRQASAVKPEAIAHRGTPPPHDEFRAGVFAAYGGHAAGALQRGENVHGQPLANAPAQSKNSDT